MWSRKIEIDKRTRGIVFEAGNDKALADAIEAGWGWIQDSLRAKRLPHVLKGMSFERLWDGLECYELKPVGDLIIPVLKGGAQHRYSAIPYTSNAGVSVATTSSAKTLLQVATPSTCDITTRMWWASFNASALATGINCEFIDFDAAATVTSLTPNKYSDPNAVASLCVGGSSATGYNASAEGSPTTTNIKDYQQVAPTSGVLQPFALGTEACFAVSRFARIRATGAASDTPSASVGMIWDE